MISAIEYLDMDAMRNLENHINCRNNYNNVIKELNYLSEIETHITYIKSFRFYGPKWKHNYLVIMSMELILDYRKKTGYYYLTNWPTKPISTSLGTPDLDDLIIRDKDVYLRYFDGDVLPWEYKRYPPHKPYYPTESLSLDTIKIEKKLCGIIACGAAGHAHWRVGPLLYAGWVL